jgi:putative phage-type endonuclease
MRREFLEERKTGIGGSDAPVILGVSKWGSPLQIWAQKVRALEKDIEEEESGDSREELEWGRLVEPIVINAYGERTGRKVTAGEMFCRHPEINWLIGHADGHQLVEEWPEGLVECKNVHWSIWMEWLEDAPLPVKVQVQHYLASFNLDHATAVALVGGNQLVWHDIERNQPFIDAMLEEEERFWARVVSDNPPPATAADCKFLNKLVPETRGLIIQMPSAGLDFHEELAEVKNELAKIKDMAAPLEKKKDELEAKIKQAMGDASEATLPDGSVYTFKTTKRKGFEVKPSEFRTLRLKKAK